MLSIPSTFSRHTACHPFEAISSAGLKNWPPALFTSRSSARAIQHRGDQAGGLLGLAHVPGDRLHGPRQPRSTPRPPPRRTSSRRPVIVTFAPQRLSSSAVALPRPVPPPVTSATRPSSRPGAKISDWLEAAVHPAPIIWFPIALPRLAAADAAVRLPCRLGFGRVPPAAGHRPGTDPRGSAAVALVAHSPPRGPRDRRRAHAAATAGRIGVAGRPRRSFACWPGASGCP